MAYIAGRKSTFDYVHVTYAQTGITLDGSSATVRDSRFEHNQTGILIYKVSNSLISDNVIQSNSQYGIKVVNAPDPTIQYNSIVSNGLYALLVDGESLYSPLSNVIINAENNWWGTGDPEQIPNLIWDVYDNNWLPVVDFSPYLAAEPGQVIAITDVSVTGNFFNPLRNTWARVCVGSRRLPSRAAAYRKSSLR